jgi:hypothetical protein
MRGKHLVAVVGLAVASMATSLFAGNVGYSIDGGPTVVVNATGSPNITINIGEFASNKTLHIFDIVEDGIDSLGVVTIRAASPTDGLLDIVVSRSTDGPAFAFIDPYSLLNPGLRNLGGLQILAPVGSQLPPAKNTRLSVTVRGDILGDISAGQIFRVDARIDSSLFDQNTGEPIGPRTAGGRILGNVTSLQRNGFIGYGGDTEFSYSVGYVGAQDELVGNVTAFLPEADRQQFSYSDPTSHASIGRIVVGRSDDSEFSVLASGLKGNIIADYGRIEQIFSTGNIGAITQTATIRAGLRLGTVRVRKVGTLLDESTPSQPRDGVLQRNVYANMKSSARINGGSATSNPADFYLLETNGDFVGNIEVDNFYGRNNVVAYPTARRTQRQGIFVGGDFIGSITSKYNWCYGDMIARSFRGPIVIGQQHKGAIVAVGRETSSDPLDGTIESVTVGYRTDLSQSPNPCSGAGMSGSNEEMISPPFETGQVASRTQSCHQALL